MTPDIEEVYRWWAKQGKGPYRTLLEEIDQLRAENKRIKFALEQDRLVKANFDCMKMEVYRLRAENDQLQDKLADSEEVRKNTYNALIASEKENLGLKEEFVRIFRMSSTSS